jgi:hypothetical protein
VTQLRQHCDQQRVRDQHRGEHAERGTDPELGDEVEPEEGKARDRDRDRQPGEEDCAAGRRPSLGGRLARRQPFMEQLPETGNDEQRVVDPDADADHRHE